VLFGKNKIERLDQEVEKYARSILLVYGSESIKKSGLYTTVTSLLDKADIKYVELSKVPPNPRIENVREGIRLCKEQGLEFLLAVGGGSVIDCAKTIAAGLYFDGDPWEMFLHGDSVIKDALPIGTILTIAATGSEMNGNAVISNLSTEQKLAIHHDVLRPRFSILDPTYTFTVPPNQTAVGIVDIMSHVFEQYFSPTADAYVQDRLAEAMLKTCIYYGPLALKEPMNYEARAQLMWTSSLALNGLLGYGKVTDWATHGIEHAVSAAYDVTHGVGLAILTPWWMEYVLSNETVEKFATYGRNVWNLSEKNNQIAAKKAIGKTREFFKSLKMPTTLRDVGIKQEKLNSMAKQAVFLGNLGKVKKLGEQDILAILQNAF